MALEKNNTTTSRAETPTTLASEEEDDVPTSTTLSSEEEEIGSDFEPIDHHSNDTTSRTYANSNRQSAATSDSKTPIDPPEIIINGAGAGSGRNIMAIQPSQPPLDTVSFSIKKAHHNEGGEEEPKFCSRNANQRHRDKRNKFISSGGSPANSDKSSSSSSSSSILTRLATNNWWRVSSKYVLPLVIAVVAILTLIFSIALLKFTLDEKEQTYIELRRVKVEKIQHENEIYLLSRQFEMHMHEISHLKRQLETEKSRITKSLDEIHQLLKIQPHLMESGEKRESQPHYFGYEKMHSDGENTAVDTEGRRDVADHATSSSSAATSSSSSATASSSSSSADTEDESKSAKDDADHETKFESVLRLTKRAAWCATAVPLAGLAYLLRAKNAARHVHPTMERTTLVILAPFFLPFRGWV